MPTCDRRKSLTSQQATWQPREVQGTGQPCNCTLAMFVITCRSGRCNVNVVSGWSAGELARSVKFSKDRLCVLSEGGLLSAYASSRFGGISSSVVPTQACQLASPTRTRYRICFTLLQPPINSCRVDTNAVRTSWNVLMSYDAFILQLF